MATDLTLSLSSMALSPMSLSPVPLYMPLPITEDRHSDDEFHSDDEESVPAIEDFPEDQIFHSLAEYMHNDLCTIRGEVARRNPAHGANVTFRFNHGQSPIHHGVYLGFILGETTIVYWVIRYGRKHKRITRDSTRGVIRNPMALVWAISQSTWGNLGKAIFGKLKRSKMADEIVLIPAFLCSKN